MATNPTRTLVVLGTDQLGARRRHANSLFARTPLEMIQLLERNPEIDRVLLAGDFVQRHDIAEFIHDEYPAIAVSYEHVETQRPVVFVRQLAYA